VILFANFLNAAGRIIHIVLMIYVWIVILRSVLTWVRVPSLYPLTVILYHLTEPVLKPFRRYVPPYRLGGIDLSPFIVVLLIIFIDSFLVKSLIIYARQILIKHAPYF
jgi:YggT family protein